MISYAQNFEDVILNRIFEGKSEGFYVDVGAWHPFHDSVTYHFYLSGWTGINIEPNREVFKLLQSKRPNDINLNIGIGSTRGMLRFFEVGDTGLSTFSEEAAARHYTDGRELTERSIPVAPLCDVLGEYAADRVIDFLKVDVEGVEKIVLRSNDWDRFRPKVVLVEATAVNSRTEVWSDWEAILSDGRYKFRYFDGVNRFYTAEELNDVQESWFLPPNVFDKFEPAPQTSFRLQLESAKYAINELEKQVGYGRELQRKYDDAAASATALNAELESAKCAINELEKQVGYGRELQRKYDDAAASAAALNAEISRLEREERALRERIDRLTAAHRDAVALTQSLQAFTSKLENDVRRLRDEAAHLSVLNAGVCGERDRLVGELEESRRREAALLASTSWKVSYPIRAAKRLLGRLGRRARL